MKEGFDNILTSNVKNTSFCISLFHSRGPTEGGQKYVTFKNSIDFNVFSPYKQKYLCPYSTYVLMLLVSFESEMNKAINKGSTLHFSYVNRLKLKEILKKSLSH